MENEPQSWDMDFIPDYATLLKTQLETVMSKCTLDDSGLSCRLEVDKQQRLSPDTTSLYFLIVVYIFKHFQCIMEFFACKPRKTDLKALCGFRLSILTNNDIL